MYWRKCAEEDLGVTSIHFSINPLDHCLNCSTISSFYSHLHHHIIPNLKIAPPANINNTISKF